MKKNICLINNNSQLRHIIKQTLKFNNTNFIITSHSLNQKYISKLPNFIYFDELITLNEKKNLSKILNNELYEWFRDKNGKDLSEINGCSLALSHVGSYEILFSTASKYIVGIHILLKKNTKIIYFSDTQNTMKDIIKILSVDNKDNRFELLKKNNDEINFSENGSFRNLQYLKKNNFQIKILNCLLAIKNNLNFNNNEKKDNVVIFSAGKVEDFIDYYRNFRKTKFVCFTQFHSISDIKINKNVKHFYINYGASNRNKAIISIISKLKPNYIKKSKFKFKNIFIKILEQRMFNQFDNTYTYYNNSIKFLSKISPKVCILGADAYENFLIFGFAARSLNIPLIHYPHGLYIHGYDWFKKNNNNFFQHGFAFSNELVEFFSSQGLSKNKIKKIHTPYFGNPKNINLKKDDKGKKKCLILANDYFNTSPMEDNFKFDALLFNTYRLLCRLDIEVKGIKYRANGIKNIYIDKTQVKIFDSSTNLENLLNDIDIIVGPPSSAFIECSLLGVKYYVVQHTRFHEFSSSISRVFYNYVNVSFGVKELEKNIKIQKIFKKNYSIQNLFNISKKNNDFENRSNELIRIINNI